MRLTNSKERENMARLIFYGEDNEYRYSFDRCPICGFRMYLVNSFSGTDHNGIFQEVDHIACRACGHDITW